MKTPDIQATDASRCANAQCPNRSDHGAFKVFCTTAPVLGHRGLTLMLCAPCSEAVRGTLTGNAD